MDAHEAGDEAQLRLFDPDDLDPWKLACGRLLRGSRTGQLPRSLGELSRITGLDASELRRSEKLAERREVT
jgi:hypothetical protein